MKRHTHVLVCALAVVLSLSASSQTLLSHDHRSAVAFTVVGGMEGAATAEASKGAVSGQGVMKFRVLYTSERLPEEARKVLAAAHGGFTVDRRPGRGETYFALAGAGILQISADLKTVRLLETPEAIREVNLHNVTIWYGPDGTGYLTFPAHKTGDIYTTTLDGALVHTLQSPTPKDDFDHPTVNDYFRGKGNFAPTDVEHLDGKLYVTTGYSSLDYVLTARVLGTNPFRVTWHDLAFGGKGDGPGRFGTGHGITLTPDKRHLAVSDRPNAKVERFTRYGHYRSTLKLPVGSFPIDIDYVGKYAVVGCLYGPDRSKGAPIYILEGDRVISTVMVKDELGLKTFQHIHDAVVRQVDGKLYIIAQTWNPGDVAILEQVVP